MISVWRIFFQGDFSQPMGNYVGRVYGINLFLNTDLCLEIIKQNGTANQNYSLFSVLLVLISQSQQLIPLPTFTLYCLKYFQQTSS